MKLPVLILGAFLLGFLPTFLLYRTRMWTMKRRLEAVERQLSASLPAAPAPAGPAGTPGTTGMAGTPEPIVVDTRTTHPS